MKNYLILLALFSCLLTRESYAENETTCCFEKKNRFYVSPYMGLSFSEKLYSGEEMKPGYCIGSAVGYKFSNLRFEIEAAYQRSARKCRSYMYTRTSGFKEIGSFMANVCYDFDVDFCLKPFLGAGVGYYESRLHTHWHRQYDSYYYGKICKDRGLVGQSIVGVKYSLSDEFEISIDYRLFQQEKKRVLQRVGLSATRYF